MQLVKKIWFWGKFILGFIIVLLFFVLFFQNRAIIIADFNYILGEIEQIHLTTLLIISFIVGALFTLIITLLINIPIFIGRMRLKSRIKELEATVERLKHDSVI